MSQSPRRRVAVVGATGVAGQQFLVSLDRHPWFEVVALAASSRSAGKPYREAITDDRGHAKWGCEEPLPEVFGEQRVVDAETLDLSQVDLVFSAVESGAARALEARMAPLVPVVSTSSAFRYEHDVPILVPGVNDGMTTVVGRLREDAVLPNGIKFVLLSHNTKLGAAKGALLVAEHLVHQGLA